MRIRIRIPNTADKKLGLFLSYLIDYG
jgi:hypothetical protein